MKAAGALYGNEPKKISLGMGRERLFGFTAEEMRTLEVESKENVRTGKKITTLGGAAGNSSLISGYYGEEKAPL